MKFIPIFFVLFIATSIISCNGQTSEKIKEISPKVFSKKMNATPNAQVIDVRTPQEFDGGHLDQAINIDWFDSNFDTKIQKLDKTKPVFVYCKTNGRSPRAARKLEELGFSKIYNMQGGLIQWDAEGLSKPTDKIIGMTSQKYAKLLNSDKKVLIDFYAKWCAPCQKMSPYLQKMQKELADKVVIIKLDADENKTLIQEMKINGLPTLILYENKKIKWKHSGFISEEDLKKQL